MNTNKVTSEKTLMEISGYPHYENVCTNILSFFFDTSESHNMKDLFIKALFKAIGVELDEVVVKEVIREQVTPENKRIDLVILTDEFVVGIENKIYAGLYNDLAIYSQYLNKLRSGNQIYKIILSLYNVSNISDGFINITYTEFFNAINELIDSYKIDYSNKYYHFLNDFIVTINNLKGDYIMNTEVLNYLSENLQDIEKFIEFINVTKKQMKTKVEAFGKLINYNKDNCRQWIYSGTTDLGQDLVHDISIDDAVVAVDTWYKPDKWEVIIWIRKRGKNNLSIKENISPWVVSKGVSINDFYVRNNQRYELVKDFHSYEEVSNFLQELLNKLCN